MQQTKFFKIRMYKQLRENRTFFILVDLIEN